MEYKKIQQFADEWIKKFADKKTTGYDLCDDATFGTCCLDLGFQLDIGELFCQKYDIKQGINMWQEVLNVLPQVTDIFALGNIILSYWRNFNHWSNSVNEIVLHKDWFVQTLTKLKQLATTVD